MKNNDDLVLLRAFDTDWQAHIAKGILAEHGIPSTIDNEMMGTILPIGFNTIGGFRLMVCAVDFEKARELVATMAFD